MRAPHLLPRPFVLVAASLLALVASIAPAGEPEDAAQVKAPVIVTGVADTRLESFDRLMTEFLTENKLPGASLAVARNGRLVYARGFGVGDIEAKTPVQPDSLFRIASISKPLTAAAVMQLVERGKLKLDDHLVDLLDVRHEGKPVPPGDPRLKDVTVRHLLQHRGGWDRDKSFDPMFRSVKFAKELGTEPPASSWQVITAMWSRPLDFDPGERYSYCNYGYCLLGRIIEKVSGMTYETYIRKEILEPLAIDSMRIGKTLLADRAPGEVRYVMGDNGRKKQGPAVLGPALGEPISMPYGGWYLEAMDAHGAWLATPSDLVRFASAFDPPRFGTILNQSSIETMFTRPEGRAGHKADGTPEATFYACGWHVRDKQPGASMNTWHSGYLDGATCLLVRRHDGLAWAVLFNSDTGSNGKSAATTIDPLIHKAANAVKEWPMKDLFDGKNAPRRQEASR